MHRLEVENADMNVKSRYMIVNNQEDHPVNKIKIKYQILGNECTW